MTRTAMTHQLHNTAPVFVTGNQNKAEYLSRLLCVSLEHQKIDLEEIQSMSLEEIVEHKVRQVYDIAKRSVLVENTALHFDALNGLPGPFIKFFLEGPDGLEKLCCMLDVFDDRRTHTASVIGYYDGKHV